MPTHVQTLVAHYLAANYPSALPPFLAATHLPEPELAHPPQPDLQTLVIDYESHVLAEQLQQAKIDEDEVEPSHDGSWTGWKLKDIVAVQMPGDVKLTGLRRSLEGISAANLLTVGVTKVPKREFNTASASFRASYPQSIIVTSVDKTLKFIDYDSGEVDRIFEPHKAAVLSFAFHPLNPRYLLTGSMDGTTILTDVITSTQLQAFQSSKFVVRVAFSPDGRYFATASYDRTVTIYAATSSALPPPPHEDDIPLDETDDASLACEPQLRYSQVRQVKVDSNPEAIVFHPQSKWLIYTLRASHLMYYLRLPPDDNDADIDMAEGEAWDIRTKSFNPHPLDNHVSFAVLNLCIHPSGKVIACQTGDHKGHAGERILVYGVEPDEFERLACIWTGADADDFVLPRMAWLPDGSGFVTTTPNGYLNLIALSGETRSSVKIHGASDLGQASSEVVRDCTVVALEDGGWEVVSVGYDRRIRISR